MTGNNVGSFACSPPGQTIVYGNQIYTQDGTASECGKTPPQSPGTTVAQWPSDAELLGWAAAKLGMPQSALHFAVKPAVLKLGRVQN